RLAAAASSRARASDGGQVAPGPNATSPERRSSSTAPRAAVGTRRRATARASTTARSALAVEAEAIASNLAQRRGRNPPHDARSGADAVKEPSRAADTESARRTDAAAQPPSREGQRCSASAEPQSSSQPLSAP